MKFRRARRGDLARIVEINLAAYPAERAHDARRRAFTHHPFASLSDLVVVEDRGVVVAQAFLLPLRTWFGGRRLRMSGIAQVGVAPEARGQGIATALFAHLHAVSHERGDVLTMLYPFRQGFYTRLGYAPTSSRRRLVFDARAVPRRWAELAQGRVRLARGTDKNAIRQVYGSAAKSAAGWIERPDAFWGPFFAREERTIFVVDKAGYVAFSLEQPQLHGETTVTIDELVANEPEARRALLGAVSRLRDQATEIILEVSDGDPLELALVDLDARRFGTEAVEHAIGEVVAGPMVRVEDVARAVAARGWSGDGAFDLVVDGAPSLHVNVTNGRARVGRPTGRGSLRTTRAGAAAIFYGGLSVSGAIALGLAELDRLTPEVLDRIVRLGALGPIDAF